MKQHSMKHPKPSVCDDDRDNVVAIVQGLLASGHYTWPAASSYGPGLYHQDGSTLQVVVDAASILEAIKSTSAASSST